MPKRAEEWTEYHLTPNGWVRGSHYDDERPYSERLTSRPKPNDTVKTVEYSFIITPPSQMAIEHGCDEIDAVPSVYNGCKILWVLSDQDLVEQLEKQFGKYPR
ncbi:MAG: hypothetical protein ACR2LR_01140 [Hassallia sp.]